MKLYNPGIILAGALVLALTACSTGTRDNADHSMGSSVGTSSATRAGMSTSPPTEAHHDTASRGGAANSDAAPPSSANEGATRPVNH